MRMATLINYVDHNAQWSNQCSCLILVVDFRTCWILQKSAATHHPNKRRTRSYLNHSIDNDLFRPVEFPTWIRLQKRCLFSSQSKPVRACASIAVVEAFYITQVFRTKSKHLVVNGEHPAAVGTIWGRCLLHLRKQQNVSICVLDNRIL